MPKVLTVSQFVESIRGFLRETVGVVTVQGEVSGYQTRKDTLVFFELKDESSRVLCFGKTFELRKALEDGMEIRVTGYPSIFKSSGKFHLYALEVELVGEGALRKAYEFLKKKLEAEGLFRVERKRPLPRFPNTIGLITSPDAAAYTDVLRILKNRWPTVQVKFAAVPVQGAGAVRQIVRALEHFSTSGDVDVVVLTRGGGSLEDLQAFNDELVARAVYASRVPVVVGVGHERDVTIADYVADVRASTPSNAAERLVPDQGEILHRLDVMSSRLVRAVAGTIELEGGRLRELTSRLGQAVELRTGQVRLLLTKFSGASSRIRERIARLSAELESVIGRLNHRWQQRLAETQARFMRLWSLLQSLSPLAILKRGYSITFNARRRIVKQSRDLQTGESIRTRFSQGEATSTVTSTS